MSQEKRSPIRLFLMVLAGLFILIPLLPAQVIPPSMYSALKWRLIGPFRGGRVLAVAGIPAQPDIYYFGSVGGGVWKSTDGGRVWKPLWDKMPVASVGALAIAPSDPNVLYVGTGEADMRSDISFGDGIYKSTDAGRSWTHLGLEDTRHIGKILVDPRHPNIVLVAALGHAYGPNAERGVYRSEDGGRHWKKVLFEDENTGAIDLAFDPGNPRTVYAALWRARRPAWSTYPPMGGPGSGLYKSTDEGLTWHRLSGNGLPEKQIGRIGVAVAPGVDGKIVYALIEAPDGGLFRSDDGGLHWTRLGTDPRIRGRAWYFSRVFVDPKDPDTVYAGNVALYRSIDGGRTFQAIKGAPGGDDYHYLWIDPTNPRRMIVASDQGATISVDRGETWSTWYNQPTGQFYHVTTDNQFPYRVYGAQQDSGTASVVNRSDYGSITYRDWYSVGAGESGYLAPDPAEPDVVYGGDVYGRLSRFNRKTGQSQNITPWPASQFGQDPRTLKYRFTWTSPLVFSPQDPHRLYFGAQVLLESTDQGNSWQAVSPDLTRSGEEKEPSSPQPGMAGRGRGVIYSIAPSPLQQGLIWVGTDDGLIHLTRNAGKTWQNVTPPELTRWSKISLLEASPHDPASAYAAVDRHRLDDFKPYIYRTHDYGRTWTLITGGIEQPAFVRAVREDPVRRGLLFAGTETGVYFSADDGDHWQSLQLNLPTSPIRDLVVHGNDLVVATHGRAFWVLDDMTPLRRLSAEVPGSSPYLFEPAPAIRMRKNVSRDTPLPPEEPAGTNPPTGMILYYYLPKPVSGPVRLEILDRQGRTVRAFSSDDSEEFHNRLPAPTFPGGWLGFQNPPGSGAGMHRFVWDLRLGHPRALRFSYDIAATFGDTPIFPQGPLLLPGAYQVRLSAGTTTLTRPLTIEMDPRLKTSMSDLKAQFDLERKIGDIIDKTFAALQKARRLQAQVRELQERLPEGAAAGPLGQNLKKLAADLKVLMGSAGRGTGQSGLAGLNSSLGSLLSAVDSADKAPTRQEQDIFEEASREAGSRLDQWRKIIEEELPAVNRLAKAAGIPALAVP